MRQWITEMPAGAFWTLAALFALIVGLCIALWRGAGDRRWTDDGNVRRW